MHVYTHLCTLSPKLPYSILGFVEVIDSLHRQHLRGIVVTQTTEDDTISQSLLQLCGRREFVFYAGFNPPGGGVREGEGEGGREGEGESISLKVVALCKIHVYMN